MTALILLFLFQVEAKQVCAPNTGTASFSMGCKLVSEAEAKRMQAEIDAKKGIKEKAPAFKVGMYSGKPGFFILDEDKATDAVLMNAKASDKLYEYFAKVKLGQTMDCELEGMHQSIGYTVFSVNNCK